MLEQGFDKILRDWGHNVLLRRKNPNGKGWQNQYERHTVRHKYPSTRALPQIQQERAEGMTHSVDMIYYFRPEASPREGDLIYEYDERYAEVSDSQTIFTIDYAVPMRGKGGKLVYWMAGCTRDTPN